MLAVGYGACRCRGRGRGVGGPSRHCGARPPHFLPVPHSCSVRDVAQQANRGGECLRWGHGACRCRRRGRWVGGPSRHCGACPPHFMPVPHSCSVRDVAQQSNRGGTCLRWGHGACRCRGDGRWGGGPSRHCGARAHPTSCQSRTHGVSVMFRSRPAGGAHACGGARRLSVAGPRTSVRHLTCPAHFQPVLPLMECP